MGRTNATKLPLVSTQKEVTTVYVQKDMSLTEQNVTVCYYP